MIETVYCNLAEKQIIVGKEVSVWIYGQEYSGKITYVRGSVIGVEAAGGYLSGLVVGKDRTARASYER